VLFMAIPANESSFLDTTLRVFQHSVNRNACGMKHDLYRYENDGSLLSEINRRRARRTLGEWGMFNAEITA